MGVTATSRITVVPVFSFAGTVSLSTTASSALQVAISPAIIDGASGISTLTVTALLAGNYTITVTGTSGSLVHSVIVTFDVAVPDYLLVSSPTSETLLAGQIGNSTISVQSINGFTGNVNLSASILHGLNCTLSSTSITLGAVGTVRLSCQGNAGVYAVTVTGASGDMRRSSSLSYAVQDFPATSAPTTLMVDAGAAIATSITIVPLQCFSGTVSVNAATSSGLVATVSSSTIAQGSGTVALTLGATLPGNYTATVTAASDTLAHFLKLTVQVQDFSIISGPETRDANIDQKTTSIIHISSTNHFARSIIMAVNDTRCDLSLTEIPASNNTTLSCRFPIEGVFHINVTGASGSLSHSLTVAYVISNTQQVPGAGLLGGLPIAAFVSATALVGVLVYLFTRRRGW